MQEKSKSMRLTRPTSRGSRAYHIRLQGAKNRPDEGQEFNALVVRAVQEVLKQNKHENVKYAHK